MKEYRELMIGINGLSCGETTCTQSTAVSGCGETTCTQSTAVSNCGETTCTQSTAVSGCGSTTCTQSTAISNSNDSSYNADQGMSSLMKSFDEDLTKALAA